MTGNLKEQLTLLPHKYVNSMLHGLVALGKKKTQKSLPENRRDIRHSWLKGLACQPGQTQQVSSGSDSIKCSTVELSTLINSCFTILCTFWQKKER